TAQAVDGRSGNGGGQPRQQGGHTGDVAVLLAGPVGVAEEDFFDVPAVQFGYAFEQSFDHVSCQVVVAYFGQGTAVLAAGGTIDVEDVAIGHCVPPGGRALPCPRVPSNLTLLGS